MEFRYGTASVLLRNYCLVLSLFIYKCAFEYNTHSNKRYLPLYCWEKYLAMSIEYSILLFTLVETAKKKKKSLRLSCYGFAQIDV